MSALKPTSLRKRACCRGAGGIHSVTEPGAGARPRTATGNSLAAGASVMVLAGLCGPQLASAQGPGDGLDGSWQAGATKTDVTMTSWGADCGPRPRSSRSKGGGNIEIVRRRGQLAIEGKNHEVQTDRCWSRNPNMRRRSSTYLDGTWTTRCQTPEHDAHAESGTYIITTLGPDRLQYRDISRYNWKLRNSNCVATITTVQELLRAGRRVPPPTASRKARTGGAEQAAQATPPACIAGEPARLVLRPARAAVEIGGRLCYRARVVDTAGCAVPRASISYSVAHAPALRGKMERNCFRASDSAAEAKGAFRVTATANGLRAHAVVTVQSLDLSGLIAMRLETGGITGFEADPDVQPARPQSAAHVSTGRTQQRSNPAADHDRLIMVAVGGGAVIALMLMWLRVRRKAPTRSMRPVPRTQVASEPPDGIASDETWICPACRHGYPAALGKCPKCLEGDNTLIPYAEFNRRAQAEPEAATRRCRACGADLLASANFCGHCGSRDLVDTQQG